jgi:hypothetical protein
MKMIWRDRFIDGRWGCDTYFYVCGPSFRAEARNRILLTFPNIGSFSCPESRR